MFARVVLAYDGSDGAKVALANGAQFAPKCGSEMHVLAMGALPEYAETRSEVEEAREQVEHFYKERVKEAAAMLAGKGIAVRMRVEMGKPGDVIIRVAKEVRADLIVLGANPHSVLRRRVVGATADKVVDRAACTVMVVR
ncbi:universal stress protein [Myxococcota bacterium]|nr:universal stress protein [Myxococcota bacterium]